MHDPTHKKLTTSCKEYVGLGHEAPQLPLVGFSKNRPFKQLVQFVAVTLHVLQLTDASQS